VGVSSATPKLSGLRDRRGSAFLGLPGASSPSTSPRFLGIIFDNDLPVTLKSRRGCPPPSGSNKVMRPASEGEESSGGFFHASLDSQVLAFAGGGFGHLVLGVRLLRGRKRRQLGQLCSLPQAKAAGVGAATRRRAAETCRRRSSPRPQQEPGSRDLKLPIRSARRSLRARRAVVFPFLSMRCGLP
jgi:hypothetical protein